MPYIRKGRPKPGWSEEYKKQFGEEVRRRRRGIGWSMERLAKLANVHWLTIQEIETNKLKTKPRDATVVVLLSALDQIERAQNQKLDLKSLNIESFSSRFEPFSISVKGK